FKSCASGQVRPGHDRDGSPPRNQIAERCTLEEDLVVVVRGDFGAAITIARQPRPARRAEDPPDQLTLNVALEKALRVLVEQPVAIERIRQCGEAATGHASYRVHFVEQGMLMPVDDDRRAPQLLEYAVRQGGGPSAAAGERQ